MAGRVFISAGHGGMENGRVDPGAIAGGTTEAQQMILLRDQVVVELRRLGQDVLAVPDDLSLKQSIAWINGRARSGDVALEIHADAFDNPTVRGASIFYIANNDERRRQAEQILMALLRRVPQLPSRGAKPDTATAVGRLGICRQVIVGSMLLEVGFLTNPDDRSLLINQRQAMAQGIAEGLFTWVQGRAPSPTPSPAPSPSPSPAPSPTPDPRPDRPIPVGDYPQITIRLNNQNYAEQGLLVNGNAYIPVDLVDRFGVPLTKDPSIRLIQYQGVVYIKAIDLREFNITVGWDSAARTVIINSILKICPGQFDRIMGHGNTSDVQMQMFLRANNEKALEQFKDLPTIYREEGTIEGVNYDIAFCQMCVETGFLRFGNDVSPTQNNFAGLGAIGGGAQGASFPSARIGVRAQVQHLKAYASMEPMVQEIVDPRFRFVTRGIAPLITQLSGRWAADLGYGVKLLAMLRRLYESAGLL